MKRWIATIWYRSDKGECDVQYPIEELDEIAEIVERGPDWHTIIRIEIELVRNYDPELTLEVSATR